MTPEQKAEYLKYLQGQGLSPDEAEGYFQYSQGSGEKTSGTQKVVNKVAQVVSDAANHPIGKAGLAVLDYPRSVVVGTGQSLAKKGKAALKGLEMLPSDPINASKTLVSAPFEGYPELLRGLTGRAPSLSDVLAEEGVPELGSVSGGLSNVRQALRDVGAPGAADYVPEVERGSILDLTGRGTLGFVGDIAAGLAGSAALSSTAKNVGKRMYKSPFSEADEIASQFGKSKSPSEVAWENRDKIVGGEKNIKEGVKQVLDQKLGERQAIIDLVEASGSEADLGRAASETRKTISDWRTPGREGGNVAKANAANSFARGLDETIDFAGKKPTIPASTVERIVDSPVLDEAGRPYTKVVQETIPEIAGRQGVGIRGTMDLKTSTYGNVADDAWREFAKTPEGAALTRQWGKGLRQETERLAEEFSPGMGETLASQNQDIGSLLTTADTYSRDALKQARRPGVTQVDMMALAADPTLAVAKNVARIGRMPGFKTRVGKNAYDKLAPAISTGGGKINPILRLLDDAAKQQLIIDLQGE